MVPVGGGSEPPDLPAYAVGCLDDLDCRENELCYRNTSWFHTTIIPFVPGNLSAELSSRLGCECNTWYAWTGPNCDEYSSETMFFGTWAIFFTINALVCLFTISISLCTYLTFFVVYRDYNGKLGCKFRRNCRCNAFVRVMVSFWLASFGMFLWALSLAASSFDVSGHILAEDWFFEGDPYKGRHHVYGFFGGFSATVFIALGGILLSVEWIRVSSNLRKYRFIRGNDNAIRKLKFLLALFMTAALSTVAGGLAKQLSRTDSGPNIQGFSLTLFGICLVIVFLYSAVTFTKIITDISRKTREIAERYKTPANIEEVENEVPPRVRYEIEADSELDFAEFFVVPETAKSLIQNDTLFSSQNVSDFEREAWELFGPPTGMNSSAPPRPIFIIKNGTLVKLPNPIFSSISEDRDTGQDWQNEQRIIEPQIENNKLVGEYSMTTSPLINDGPVPGHLAFKPQTTMQLQSQADSVGSSSENINLKNGRKFSSASRPRLILKNGASMRLPNPRLSFISEDAGTGDDGRNNHRANEPQLESNSKTRGEHSMEVTANPLIKQNHLREHFSLKKPQSQGETTVVSSDAPDRTRTVGDRLLSIVPRPNRMGSEISSRIMDVLKRIRVPPEVEPAFKKIIFAVRDTAILASISAMGYVLVLFSFAIMDTRGSLAFHGIGWRENGNPGNPFSGIKFSYYFQLTFSSFIVVAFTRYIFVVSRNPSKVSI